MSRTGGLAITTIGLVAFLASLVVLLAWQDDPASAQSAVPGTIIIVNTAADEANTDGDCSLREAIRAANSNKAVGACAAGRAGARRDPLLPGPGGYHRPEKGAARYHQRVGAHHLRRQHGQDRR
jgi:CSLREA domain-containing protein